jgi:hypothetical protein
MQHKLKNYQVGLNHFLVSTLSRAIGQKEVKESKSRRKPAA